MRNRVRGNRRAAPQSRRRPRRSSRTTGRRHETQTINTTALRRARLARSRSACSSSGLSARCPTLGTRASRECGAPRVGLQLLLLSVIGALLGYPKHLRVQSNILYRTRYQHLPVTLLPNPRNPTQQHKEEVRQYVRVHSIITLTRSLSEKKSCAVRRQYRRLPLSLAT